MERHNDFSRSTYNAVIAMTSFAFIREAGGQAGDEFLIEDLEKYTEHDLASKVSPDLPFDSPNTVQDLSEKESGDGAWEHASEHPNDAATTFAMDVFSRDVFEYIDDLVVDHAEIAWDSTESVYRIPESVLPESPYHN
jgi:hypothetical protein